LCFQERYNALTTSYLRSANAIVLVYDITNRESFEALITKWLPFLKSSIPMNAYGSMDARIAIVANKLDLNDDRVVPKKDGVKLATFNNCRFYETSARSGRNVNEMFRAVCDTICDYWYVLLWINSTKE
jgi:small GTP-binding protein